MREGWGTEMEMTNDPKNNGATREDICPGKKSTLDLNSVREKIDFATEHDAREKTGPQYWRSLEELAGSKEFQEALHREFPKGASVSPSCAQLSPLSGDKQTSAERAKNDASGPTRTFVEVALSTRCWGIADD